MPKYDFKKVCMISIKLHSNFIEITLRHSSSPVNLQRIFRTPKNTSGGLLLTMTFLEAYSKPEHASKFGLFEKMIQRLEVEVF